ncbi:MAG: hypothetical protein M3Y58_04875 [Chloroflexota bacterium]|nr:hypothetical protein [Chloroflexota bacterium]
MSSRRDRAKADATRTPLADLAPTVPARPDAKRGDEPETQPAPDDDMLPESSATMPAAPPETDTAPANVRSRPGARKVSDRSRIPVVPRTIAEMQSGVYETNTVETDALAAEERAATEPEPAPLFISPRTLLVTTFVPYAILILIPAIADLLARVAGAGSTLRLIVDFVAIATGGLIGLFLLLRNWRVAFHDVPTELHPISILVLWEQRASGERRDGWVTGSLAVIAVFIVVLLFSVILNIIARRFSALYAIPYLFIALFAKAVGAIIFVGYLQRGLFASQSATKATFLTGALYGVALAIANTLTFLASGIANPATILISFVLVSVAVGFTMAWFRLRSGSLLAAVAFQLLLLVLGIAV